MHSMENHFCEMQLIATLTEIASLLDQGVHTNWCSSVDFSKTFE